MAHKHSIYDTDPHFSIEPLTRIIENESGKINITQYDHNSERFTFEIPRLVDGHDMSMCNLVEIHYDNTDGKNTSSDVYEVEDIQISPKSSGIVIFSWLISGNATRHAGQLNFSISFQCTAADGTVDYEWGTSTYEGIRINPRIRNSEATMQANADTLAKWKTELFGIGDTEEASMRAVSQQEQDNIVAKGAEVLATIPEEYTQTSKNADEAVRSKGDAIACEAAGESIVISDSSDDYVRGLKLFGRSTQVTTTGKNLFNEQVRFGAYDDSTGEYVEKSHMICTANEIPVTPGVKYYNCSNNNYPLYYFFYDVNGSFLPPRYAVGAGEYITTPTGAAYMHFNISSSYGNVYKNDICVSSENIGYEPYTGGKVAPNPDYPQEIVNAGADGIGITVAGKNLWISSDTTKTLNGVTIVCKDGVYILNGMCTLSSNFVVGSITLPRTDTYTLSANNPQHNNVEYANIQLYSPSGSAVCPDNINYSTKTKELSAGRYDQRVRLENGVTYNNYVLKPMLELGSTATKFEPCKTTQLLDVNYSLPGIPVTSGGNYTDSDGQQWICDEVDLERGVYVQRVCTLEIAAFDALSVEQNNRLNVVLPHARLGEYVEAHALCSHSIYNHTVHWDTGTQSGFVVNKSSAMFRFGSDDAFGSLDTANAWLQAQKDAGTPLMVGYILATPIEISLTAEEIAAFKALRTNYPNTTILNDAGAWMSIKYNADTKTYVENPKTLKLVDSNTGVVYELKIVDGNLTVAPV